MNKTQPTSTPARQAELLAKSERKKIIVMVVAVAALGIGYLVSLDQRERLVEGELVDLPVKAQPERETISVPEFDTLEVLEAVRDDAPADRVVLEADALNAAFDYGRLLTARHYDAIGVRDLTPEVHAELTAEPDSHRIAPIRARGEVVSVKKRRRADTRPEEFAGTLRLEDGSFAHFVVLELDGVREGDFARVDGVFLKLYSTEGDDGWWEGPLICGAEAIPSFPRIDLEDVVLDALADVQDDTLEGHSGLPFEAKWQLLARALTAGDVNWDEAPELDGPLITEVFTNGDEYRGQPFRVGISRNIDGGVERVGENPLRLEKVSTGWIGNQTWKGKVPCFYYIAPFDRPELGDRYGVAKYLTGRGFFFKNMTYTKMGGDLGRVPVFIMSSVDTFTATPDGMPRLIMWGVLAATILMVFVLSILLARDRKKAADLQQELVRRRRARREKLGHATPAPGS